MIEVGRVCLKVAGREAGRYCVVVKRMDEKFVMVTGPRDLTSVKRRRCNISHLEPLMESLKIKSDADDSDVLKAYQQASLITKLGIEPVKARKPEGKARAEAKKEKPEVKAKPAGKKTRKPAAKPKKEKPKAEKKTRPRKAKASAKKAASRKK